MNMQKLTTEALSWQRTPYMHRQNKKHLAADCATFPLAVYEAVLETKFPPVPEYPAAWFLHSSDERYLAYLSQVAEEVEGPLPGGFVVYKMGRAYSHGAIILNWPLIIHCDAKVAAVTLADASNEGTLVGRDHKFFRVTWHER